jgi:ankyrin repeat protein
MPDTASSQLFDAIDAGDIDAVGRLVDDDPAVADARDEQGVSAVRHALYRGQRTVAARIAASAAALDVFDLAALGDAERLGALLRLDPVAVYAFSEDGFTALHFAAFLGGAAAARVLLDAGADVNAIARNPMQVQPLHSAVAGNPDVVALLLDAGADANAKQQRGFVTLHEAALRGNAELVDALLAHGADPAITDDDGNTAADHAQRAGHTDLAARLHRV